MITQKKSKIIYKILKCGMQNANVEKIMDELFITFFIFGD